MRFDVVLDALANRKRVRTLVEQITHLPEGELLDSLTKEFEQVCERYKSMSDFAAEVARKPVHVPSARIQNVEFEFVPRRDRPQPTERDCTAKRGELQRQLVDVERLIKEEVRRDWDNKAAEICERITRLKTSEQVLREQLAEIEQTAVEREESHKHSEREPSPPVIDDDDILYLYGVATNSDAMIGLHLLDRKGIDGRSNILVESCDRIKLFFSIVSSDSFPMTTTGRLLLGRKESRQLRENHEAVVNDMRTSQVLIPFAPGALVIGVSELHRGVEKNREVWENLLRKEESVSVKELRLYALDECISAIFAPQQGGKIDVKLLEKVLHREQKLAEAIHCTLKPLATSSTIHSVVGFGSGFASDWKLILESSYDIVPNRREQFFASITALRQQYYQFRLILEAVGAGGRLELAE